MAAWTQAELAESQNAANQYYSSHQNPGGWTPDDINNQYQYWRNQGYGHADAMAHMTGVLGWAANPAPTPAGVSDAAMQGFYQDNLGRPGTPEEYAKWNQDYGGDANAIRQAIYDSSEAQAYRTKSSAPSAPSAPSSGGGGGGGGAPAPAAPAAPGWTAPQGPPGSGFGAQSPTYTPPVYASDPNAPVYTPGPAAPTFTPLPAYVGPVYTPDGTGTTPVGDGAAPTGDGSAAAGAVPGVVAPTWTGGDFVNPTMEDVQAGPGYQSRLDALIKGRERQSAAQGTILSGGTLKALDRAGQDYATNEYQTYRTNALENYKQRYGRFTDAVGMDLAARTQNANETQNAFGNALSTYGANANQNQQTFQNQNTLYNQGNARTLSDYLTNVTGQRTAALDAASAKRNAETDYWSRLQDLNQTGANLAGGSYRV